MAAIGFLDYAYKLLTGEIDPPNEAQGTGADINTINQFADDVQTKSKATWDKVQLQLSYMNAAIFQKTGESMYSAEFRKILSDVNKNLGESSQNEAYGRAFEYTLKEKGAKFIFSEKANPDSASMKQLIGDVDTQLQFADNAEWMGDIINLTRGTFIDPHTYYDNVENVPHTEAITNLHNHYESQVKDAGFVEKILAFVKSNPDKFNVGTITKAFKNETNFMQQVNNTWDTGNTNKSIQEGDAWGVFKSLFGDGITVSGHVVTEIGDATIGADGSPLKPFWDLFKNLWENAGTYIEYILIAVAIFALLWVAGEIKTIARYILHFRA
jgi:hypothetical protein